jgi:hypothetical protein
MGRFEPTYHWHSNGRNRRYSAFWVRLGGRLLTLRFPPLPTKPTGPGSGRTLVMKIARSRLRDGNHIGLPTILSRG